MKKIIFAILAASAIGSFALNANAQMVQWRNSGISQEVYDHTIREEAEGKDLWAKLRGKQVSCEALSDEEFGVLGEYFMGQMTGTAHPAMNAMMIQMHGEEGEEQIHVAMGKRLSGCDTAAALPAVGAGWMPMMNMMTGGWSAGWGFGAFGLVFMILWWALIITGIAALVRWLTSQSRGSHGHGKPSLEILQERYARGEIDKKEFEEKKKDLA